MSLAQHIIDQHNDPHSLIDKMHKTNFSECGLNSV